MHEQHEFLFDEDRAYSDQLHATLFVNCNGHSIFSEIIPQEQGIFILSYEDELRFLGSTSEFTTIRNALIELLSLLEGRCKVKASDINCRFVVIREHWIVHRAAELLFRRYEAELSKDFPRSWQNIVNTQSKLLHQFAVDRTAV